MTRPSPHYLKALGRDREKSLFQAVYDLLRLTTREIPGYVPSRAYQSLYRHGARESVERAVMNPKAEGFGRVGEAGRLDLSYEWFVLNPRWRFSTAVREAAWQKLGASISHAEVTAR